MSVLRASWIPRGRFPATSLRKWQESRFHRGLGIHVGTCALHPLSNTIVSRLRSGLMKKCRGFMIEPLPVKGDSTLSLEAAPVMIRRGAAAVAFRQAASKAGCPIGPVEMLFVETRSATSQRQSVFSHDWLTDYAEGKVKCKVMRRSDGIPLRLPGTPEQQVCR